MLRLICFLFFITTCNFTFANDQRFVERDEVKQFIADIVKQYHFNHAKIVALFSKIKIRPIVTKLSLDATVANFRPWYLYKPIFVNEKRIQNGILFWQKYESVLQKAEIEFGVPASLIVATIGVETNYGRKIGNYRVIDALVNLSFGNSPRKEYFKKELIEFLLLTREEKVNPLSVKGSYAGAIGQPQFMPSSYRHYAVRFAGKPSLDLNNNIVDVIGSIANFYKKNGWRKDAPIAIPASTVGGRLEHYPLLPKAITLTQLVTQGMIADLRVIETNKNYKLLALQRNYDKEYWLVFHNFEVIKRYNHSNLYAMAVFQLSFYISSMRGLNYV